MKNKIYLRQYKTGQSLLVLLLKTRRMGISGYEGFRVTDGFEEDWFISETMLSKGLAEGTIVQIQ